MSLVRARVHQVCTSGVRGKSFVLKASEKVVKKRVARVGVSGGVARWSSRGIFCFIYIFSFSSFFSFGLLAVLVGMGRWTGV